jgi:hypothetical protein
MGLVTEDTYIQVFILLEKFAPDSVARSVMFEMLTENKTAVANSEDLPEFMSKHPKLAVEFVRAICNHEE